MAYRLVRSDELAAFQTKLSRAEARVEWMLEHFIPIAVATLARDERNVTLERERALLRELIDKNGELAAAKARADFMTMRANLLDTELTILKQRAGLPAVSAQVGKTGVGTELFQGAGADLFEDVGDAEAERLAQTGIIATPDTIAAPAAADLAPAFTE